MKEEKNIGKKAEERLVHFLCYNCEKWWSIGDPPDDRDDWYCPWCGKKQEFTES
ncbi:MAG: hypothetical protein U5L75_01825 [Candidatus Campbellbacteria bacterium]|nr:hypothetical protein [Candidatus Campbellbacteria bacterium]